MLPLARISGQGSSGCPPDSSLCKSTISHATNYGFSSGREHFFPPMCSSVQYGSSFLIREWPGQAVSREACMAGELQTVLLLPKDAPSVLTTWSTPTQPSVSDLSVCHSILLRATRKLANVISRLWAHHDGRVITGSFYRDTGFLQECCYKLPAHKWGPPVLCSRLQC